VPEHKFNLDGRLLPKIVTQDIRLRLHYNCLSVASLYCLDNEIGINEKGEMEYEKQVF